MNGTVANRRRYDVIVGGAGIAGSLIAKQLGRQGWQVLVLEAGTSGRETWEGHLNAVETFRSAVAKVPNSAFRHNVAALSPDVLDLAPNGLGFTANGYFVQNGELPYGTDYLRAVGGSGMHWLGICLRMHPDDFAVKTRYGYGRDWPIGYHDLEAYYAAAEREIGVAGDAQEQRELGIPLDPSYVYPMHKIPSSYIDEICRTTASAASATPAACRAALSQPAPCPGQGTTRILRQCHLRNRSPPDRVRPRGRLPEGPHGKPERRRARRPLQRRTILTHRDPRCA